MAMTRAVIVAVLPGDGIGPEVTQQAVQVLRTVGEQHGLAVHTREYAIGGTAVEQFGTPLPEPTSNGCLASDAVLMGAVGGPQYDSLPRDQRPETGLLAIRQALGGFANLRPAVAYPQLLECSRLKAEAIRGANVLFVRELLGGVYFGKPRGSDVHEGEPRAFNTMVYSRREVERVARVAFEAARGRRKKVTSVDKANVLECSQLWRDTVSAVGREYPDISLEHMLVDSCAMRLVTAPASFDVVVTENLFGDVLSDEASAITGSLGMLPSATVGGKIDLYEPIHGSAPDIAGKGIANPLGAIATVAMLFRYTLQAEAAAAAIERGIAAVLDAGHRTADIARAGEIAVGTAEMGRLIMAALEQSTAGSSLRSE